MDLPHVGPEGTRNFLVYINKKVSIPILVLSDNRRAIASALRSFIRILIERIPGSTHCKNPCSVGILNGNKFDWFFTFS